MHTIHRLQIFAQLNKKLFWTFIFLKLFFFCIRCRWIENLIFVFSWGGRQFVKCLQQLIRQMSRMIQISRKTLAFLYWHLARHLHAARSLYERKTSPQVKRLSTNLREQNSPSQSTSTGRKKVDVVILGETKINEKKIRWLSTWNKQHQSSAQSCSRTLYYVTKTSPSAKGNTYEYQFSLSVVFVKLWRCNEGRNFKNSWRTRTLRMI